MANKITVANQKGGVGKTFSAVHIAYALCMRGKRVLLVDMDPQYSATEWVFGRELPPEAHIAITPGAFTETLFLYPEVKPTPIKCPLGFDVLLSSKSIHFVQKHDDDALYNFQDNINGISDDYDYILFDSPPTIGNLMKAQFITCQYVIIPTQLEKDSVAKMKDEYLTIQSVKARQNPELEILGILLNGETSIRDKNGNPRNLTAIYYEDEIKNWAASISKSKELVFKERWYITATGKKARTVDRTVFDLEPDGLTAQQILSTVDEIEERVK